MYHIEKEEAIRFRKIEGLSIKDISKKLRISKSTISLWVRSIVLTKDQMLKLQEKSKGNYLTGNNNKNYIVFKEKRKKYQEYGKGMVSKCDKDFIAGLMLFWAEGNKRKNDILLSNSDPELLKFFIKFLRKYFNIKNDNISFSFQWYSGNKLTQNEISIFWLNKLNLEEKNLRKCFIDYRPVKNMGKKVGKCPYGIGRITVCNTEVVQALYGAIQEFVGFKRPEWLF